MNKTISFEQISLKYDHFLLGGNFARYYPKLQTAPMPAASDILRVLMKHNKKYYFVTNNDTLTREEYLEQMKHNFSDDVNNSFAAN